MLDRKIEDLLSENGSLNEVTLSSRHSRGRSNSAAFERRLHSASRARIFFRALGCDAPGEGLLVLLFRSEVQSFAANGTGLTPAIEIPFDAGIEKTTH